VVLLRRQPVHILHTHLFGSNTWGRILGKLAGVPVIIAHEHWSTKSEREAQIDRLLYRLSDRVLVPSEESKRVVMAADHIPARYVSVIYNGVDIEQFAPRGDGAATRQELGVPDDAVLVGYVGRLSPEKGGQDILIRSVARAKQDGHNLRLLIVGDGPLRPGLEALADRLGAPVFFTGLRPDVARLLAAMDIFVLPSLHEALPIAALEAMSARLPVIATVVGGNPEVVQDGVTGLLVPPGDEDALYEALTRLLADPALAARIAQAGQAHVHAHFTLDQMARRVEAIYDELARKKKVKSKT
jgi:glycosyltransferase involved in cell wall biosynthesis